MSLLKAVFFTLPLMVIAAIGLAYLMTTQTVQPRVDEVLLKVETAIASTEVNSEALEEINRKLDLLIAKP